MWFPFYSEPIKSSVWSPLTGQKTAKPAAARWKRTAGLRNDKYIYLSYHSVNFAIINKEKPIIKYLKKLYVCYLFMHNKR